MNNNYAAKFNHEQYQIIAELQRRNYYEEFHTPLMILLSTYNYARSVKDLAGIMCEFPGLSDVGRLQSALERCLEQGYLKVKEDTGVSICYQDEECLSKYIDRFPNDIKNMIMNCRNKYGEQSCVNNYRTLTGGASSGKAYIDFIQRINEAQSEICLPMFNTSAHEETVKALLKKAREGIKVKILLADYNKVTCKLNRGKKDVLEEWINAVADCPNIEIRLYNKLEDALLTSSLIVDRCLARLCIFDPENEKSTNGTLIEIYKHGYDLNIMRILNEIFDQIWAHSVPVNKRSFWWKMRNKFSAMIFGIAATLFLYFIIVNQPIKELMLKLCIAISSIFITTAYPKVIAFSRKIIRKLLN